MKTIKLGKEYLTNDKYKMLTDKAKKKIFEIYDAAEEKTVIELPEGLLLLNITDDDVPEDFEWDANEAVLKVPPTILGYAYCEPMFSSLMAPSFMEETTINGDMAVEFYDAELPKRPFAIGGDAHYGCELWYSKVEDEDEARERAAADRDEFGYGDILYSSIPFSDEPIPNSCWSLHIENLWLNLFADDPEQSAMFMVDGVRYNLIHAKDDGNALFEVESGKSTYVRKKEWKHITRPVNGSDENLDNYDPRLFSIHGSFELQLWSVRYDGHDIEWTESGDDQENDQFYYYDGREYNEIVDDSWGDDDEDSETEESNDDSSSSSSDDDEEIVLCRDGMIAKDYAHLLKIIDKAIEEDGPNCDLNFIDVSKIKNMDDLFSNSPFDGDISQWNVSKVESMERMFQDSVFDGDISNWNVSKVKNMSCMFSGAKFNGDISKWNVSSVTNMSFMFSAATSFNGDISNWDVSNVTDMGSMFEGDCMDANNVNPFDGDLNKWNVSEDTEMGDMFARSVLEQNGELPKWYKG